MGSREGTNRLFIGGLRRIVDKEELQREFQKFGEITDTWVAKDSPGFAFVEFSTVDQAREALEAKHKTDCFGTEIRVEFTRGSKGPGSKSEQKPRLFVGGIKDSIEKEDLKEVFEPFGAVTDVWIAHNPPGFAFVEFESMEIAEKAVTELDGTQHFGGDIKVQITKGSKNGRRQRGGHGGGDGDHGDDRRSNRHRPNPYPDRRPGGGGGYGPPPPRDNYYPPYPAPHYPPEYSRGGGDPYSRDPYNRYPDPYAGYRDPYGGSGGYYSMPRGGDPYSGGYGGRPSGGYDRRGYYY
eukprot:sb/3467522/